MKSQADPFETMLPAPMIAPVLARMPGLWSGVAYELSGGEKKLVSLATVLAMEPEILLLDEPSNGLDDNTKARLMEALSQLDLSFILISHEIDFLSETADSICEMRDGKILFDEEVYAHPHYHRHPHGTVPHEHQP
ncbi:MAG: ATP-binding cassette domain-containing protein [Desulfobacterales bacterium]|nr:ATP-binding cassette domain-containing protein [Desulfobacterales bacterium]